MKLKNVGSVRKGTFRKKGSLKRRNIFLGIKCTSHWWVKKTKLWVSEVPANGGCSTVMPCCSVRAFRRRLKEFSKYMPKGTEFVLGCIYYGFNIKGKI